MVEQQREVLGVTTNKDEEIVEQAEESFVEFKQMKAKAKSTFTKVRKHLLVFILMVSIVSCSDSSNMSHI